MQLYYDSILITQQQNLAIEIIGCELNIHTHTHIYLRKNLDRYKQLNQFLYYSQYSMIVCLRCIYLTSVMLLLFPNVSAKCVQIVFMHLNFCFCFCYILL